MKPVVYIQANDHQLVPAQVAAYSLRTRSRDPGRFDVRLLRLEETPELCRRDRQSFHRFGKRHTWRIEDPQSFELLRRCPPQLMGFRGRALVLDPDIVALGDVNALLARDMHDAAILCRPRAHTWHGKPMHFTGVMLLDCARLAHWRWQRDVDALFAGALDLEPWLRLVDEPPDTIGALEEEWNHLDTLTNTTKLLHYTDMRTQPWRMGLPVAITPEDAVTVHPDPRQERLFFLLLAECLRAGAITDAFLRDAVARKYLRADLFEALAAVTRPELTTRGESRI